MQRPANDPQGPAILHLSSERSWRGGERQLWLLARGLAARGFSQTVAAPAGSPLVEAVAGEGIECVPLHFRTALHPANALRLAERVRRHPGSVLHTHTSPTLTLASVVRRLAPVAGVVHTRRVAFPVRRSRKYRTVANHYVAISQAVAENLLAVGLDPARLSVIPSSTDVTSLDRASPTRALAHLPAAPTVGCVAQMSAEKGHETLLTAWTDVLQAAPRARLVLLGDGPLQRKLADSAASLPAGAVVMAGFRNDVPAWLKVFDLYVQPSLTEGLGSSVLDAMGSALPVVASRTGGLPEAVTDNVTGMLVPPGDPESLAAAIIHLLDQPERAASMGAAGRARVEKHFTVDAMVDGYAAVYQKVVGAD